ncbi:MAG: hydrogenase maturation protease [Pseudomonadota bacterium]
MKVTVLGLGNAVLTDDSVGLRVAERVAEDLRRHPLPPCISVEVVCNEAGGWEILDDVEGADALLLVDAILDKELRPGDFAWFPRKVFTSPRLTGVHNMDVFTAMDFARRHGMKMPDDIHVLGVGVEDTRTFSETCTPAVERAIPVIAEAVARRLSELAASTESR